MRRFFQVVTCFALLLVMATVLQAEVIDRVIAVVNNTPVLQSDWESMLRFEALMNGRIPESFTEEEKRDAFSRLVDQELIRQQMKTATVPSVTDAEVDARVKEVRAQIPTASNDETWKELLRRMGLSDAEVRTKLRSQMEILRYLDDQFRPLTRVDYRSVTRYYREQYLPALKKQRAEEVPLAQVAGKIREILVQQRIDEQINNWLQTLREGADVRLLKPFTGAGVEASEKK